MNEEEVKRECGAHYTKGGMAYTVESSCRCSEIEALDEVKSLRSRLKEVEGELAKWDKDAKENLAYWRREMTDNMELRADLAASREREAKMRNEYKEFLTQLVQTDFNLFHIREIARKRLLGEREPH